MVSQDVKEMSVNGGVIDKSDGRSMTLRGQTSETMEVNGSMTGEGEEPGRTKKGGARGRRREIRQLKRAGKLGPKGPRDVIQGDEKKEAGDTEQGGCILIRLPKDDVSWPDIKVRQLRCEAAGIPYPKVTSDDLRKRLQACYGVKAMRDEGARFRREYMASIPESAATNDEVETAVRLAEIDRMYRLRSLIREALRSTAIPVRLRREFAGMSEDWQVEEILERFPDGRIPL